MISPLNDYLSRSGDKKLPNGTYIENENGFCVYRYTDDALVLVAVYGNGRYWNQWAEDKAKAEGINKIMCGTKRNPAGFIRRHGFHIVGHILERTL